jgi:hypothetical protein
LRPEKNKEGDKEMLDTIDTSEMTRMERAELKIEARKIALDDIEAGLRIRKVFQEILDTCKRRNFSKETVAGLQRLIDFETTYINERRHDLLRLREG